jgi:hypothetical protein
MVVGDLFRGGRRVVELLRMLRRMDGELLCRRIVEMRGVAHGRCFGMQGRVGTWCGILHLAEERGSLVGRRRIVVVLVAQI